MDLPTQPWLMKIQSFALLAWRTPSTNATVMHQKNREKLTMFFGTRLGKRASENSGNGIILTSEIGVPRGCERAW